MINYKNTIRLLIGLISVVIVFHVLIVLKVIPFNIAWGGRLKTEQEMYVFESLSIALNLFLLWVVGLKARNTKPKLANTILWVFFAIFSLNTIGNLFAQTTFEKYFSILTLLFSLLILRILWNKKQNS